MSSHATNGIIFPSPAHYPKAAVFLRCQASHVFALTSLKTDTAPAEEEVCHIFGPCPACLPTSVYPHAGAPHYCPFCNRAMVHNNDGTYFCCTDVCWLSRCVAETGTDAAVKIWARMYQNQTNAHCFGYEKKCIRVYDADAPFYSTDADTEAPQILVSMSKGPAGNGK